MNDRRFISCCFSGLASFSFILCCCFWFLGDSFSPVNAVNIDRITGAEAVQRLQEVLGDPQTFEDNMRNSTQDFIADHFGSMAIAAAFGIAIRMRS
jgi:hypothetical protein